jgi:hypothetical protein
MRDSQLETLKIVNKNSNEMASFTNSDVIDSTQRTVQVTRACEL